MDSWKILQTPKTKDKPKIFEALLGRLSEAGFEGDIPYIFDCLRAYQSLIKEIENADTEREVRFPWGTFNPYQQSHSLSYFETEEAFNTPEELIKRFVEIYEHPPSRFRLKYWKSAITGVQENSKEAAERFCIPILDFLTEHPFVKSEVLYALLEQFPFEALFEAEVWPRLVEEKPVYDYLKFRLLSGNIQLDLQIDEILKQPFNSQQLDVVLRCLEQSQFLLQQQDFKGAFEVLSQNIPKNVKPLLAWQREMNILYKVVSIEKKEEAHSAFVAGINESLRYFPEDPYLLYLAALYTFHTHQPESALEQVISIIMVNPENIKCYFLLGKLFLKLVRTKDAYDVFKNLHEMYPQNVEYAAYAGIATRHFVEDSLQEVWIHKKFDKYLEVIDQLVELKLFEEIKDLPEFADDDPDVKALLMYAQVCEAKCYEGKEDKQLLFDALEIATKPWVVLKIVRKIIAFHTSVFRDLVGIKELLFTHYQQFPEDDMLNFGMGCYYYHAEKDYEKAYRYHEKAGEINPRNIQVCFERARVGEYLKQYQQAIEHILTFQQFNSHLPLSYEILGRCYYNTANFYGAYQCFRWLVAARESDYLTKDLYMMLNSLHRYISHNKIEVAKHKWFQKEVEEIISFFDSRKQDKVLLKEADGILAFFEAASLSAHTGMQDRGIQYLDTIRESAVQMKVKDSEDLLKLKASLLKARGNYQEILEILLPCLDTLQENEAANLRKISDLSYFVTVAFQKLGDEKEACHWEYQMIRSYAAIEGHDVAWVHRACFNLFLRCVEGEISRQIIEVGLFYYQEVEEISTDHIYVAHWLGQAFAAEGNIAQSIKYHQKCTYFQQQFPESYEELSELSKEYLTTSTT